jgi:hypothetical protein
MKPLLAILLIMLGCNTAAIAQDTLRFTEVGLNATPFVVQYLSFGNNDAPVTSPYILTGEKRCGKFGGRIGLGIISVNDLEKADDDNTRPAIKTNELTLAIRAGAIAYKNLSHKFSLKYGVDAFFQYDLERSTTSTTGLFGETQKVVISEYTYETGLSPFLFVQFHITPQFSIGTEALGRISMVNNVTKEENSQFPDFNDRQETVGTRFAISAPTSLFLILRF